LHFSCHIKIRSPSQLLGGAAKESAFLGATSTAIYSCDFATEPFVTEIIDSRKIRL